MKKALSRAASFLIVLLLALPLLPVTAKAATTLTDYPIGTVFKIKEDGTYQEWILVDHDYLATGNQLLMRKDTIYYAQGMNWFPYQNSPFDDDDYFTYSVFSGSTIATYLNNNYFQCFEPALKSSIKSVTIPTGVKGTMWNSYYGGLFNILDSTYNCKVFILSTVEVTGNPQLRSLNYGQSGGSFISYFDTNDKKAANTDYFLRDGGWFSTTAGNWEHVVMRSTGGISTARDSFGRYRPCIVLDASFPISAGNTIDGIITPTLNSVSVSPEWATSNTATLSATNATHYAVSTTNVAPSSGWQTSSSFTLTANGTYYAWALSATNTVSSSQSFTVSKVDTTKPTVNAVSVPTTWGTSNTVTISASDNASGIAAYAVTTGGTSAPVSGWQTSNSFTFSANATYYAWVKDQAGNVSASGFEFTIDKIDDVAPFINKVDMPIDWGTTAGITIQAQDIGSGIAEFAVTTSSTAPTGGWQETGSFTLTANGTYYAWVKDHVGNTASQQFKVATVDTTPPSISYVTVPSGWGTTSTITISASDSASGLATYAVTTTGEPPTTGWQPSKNIEITANGTYFAWAKDNVGNVSARYEFIVEKVDSTNPTVTLVNIPDEWATSSKITLSASDLGDSGLSAYAVTTTNTAPGSGWQSGTSFTLTANGTYYAWAKDGAGNISDSYEFTISKVDTDRPAVASVAIPATWGMSSTVTVNGSDTTSAIAAYAVTIGGTSAPSAGWQISQKFTFSANGTYYAWVKDQAGNISLSGYEFQITKIDLTDPVISSITMPTDWTAAAEITINAADADTGIVAYALTSSSTAPAGGWQDGSSFTITSNGTYYAWVKDGVGNTAYKSFSFSKIDSTKPTISSVSLPTSWGAANTVTISANDTGSGVAAYAVTSTNAAPSTGWQTSKSVEVTANGKYYAWAKDAVGNVSAGYEFTVTKVDSDKPVVSTVTVPDAWATSSTISISASDAASGVATYAVTTTNAAPSTGWQTGSSFTLTANGTYYAWAKDAVGNVSAGYKFTVTKVDTDKPIVDSVSVPTAWGGSSTVTISASDTASGVVSYAITTSGSAAPGSGWQESNSFTFSTNGTYYAWAKDVAGNVSAGYAFTVDKIDNTVPDITEITVPSDWSTSAEITIKAVDTQTGIATYALTQSSTVPATGWQTDSRFTVTANGTYYAWAKDGAGNTASKQFTFSKIDVTGPTISSVGVPSSWNSTSAISITATDAASGVTAYAVTSTKTEPTTGWQTEKTFEITTNGTWYAWAKDAVGNISAGYEFTVSKIDTTAPVVSSVTVPDAWATNNAVSINASDDASGVTAYAISSTNSVPSTGWQIGNSFTLTSNGTYYAWAKDTAGNTSAGYTFTVNRIDTIKPIVASVSVPTAWGSDSTVTIEAADAESGVSSYAVSSTDTVPSSGWQTSSKSTVTANGTYYAWAKDQAGNVSVSYKFTVDKIDSIAPSILGVILPEDWTAAAKVSIVATDTETGIAGYALTRSLAAPTDGWQTSPDFTATANGTYYAWVKDQAGNTAYKYFYFNKIDTIAPSISLVSVSTSWGTSNTVIISATDAASGVAAHAVTSSNTVPLDGWQAGKSVEVSGNGTWYAWAKDNVGNVSTGYEFTVSKVDSTKPIVSAVAVPDKWATSAKVTLTAFDEGGSGLSAYAVTSTNVAPATGWQPDTGFTLTSNGSYYAWAKDAAGNVSAGFAFTVSKVDTGKPVVNSVAVPGAWGADSSVSITASDDHSGVTAYAVTKNSTAPTTGWQESGNFTITSNGDWYVWVRDAVGNVSPGYKFEVAKIDNTRPVISDVSVPTDWTATAEIKIIATDDETGITAYALSKNTAVPTSGWQESSSFTLSSNGSFYAWVKDGAGNSAYKYFTVSKLDVTAPSISSVSVSSSWGSSGTVTITATDAGSGVATYALTSTNTAPLDGWQTSKSVEVSGNGTWYAWAKDNVGNVSAGYEFTVSKVDSTKPVVSAVAVPDEWATSSTVTLTASDEGGSGLSTYAVTSTNTAPATGWQTSSTFKIEANGTYYAWARDTAGNISSGYQFTINKIDTTKPMIDAVSIPTVWGASNTVTISASDTDSGIASYALTKTGAAPSTGWQTGSSFSVTVNGTYYVWAKDNAGNVSAAYIFEVGKVDAVKPIISEIITPEEWTRSAGITVVATDAETGIAGYALTRSSTEPTSGWQEGKTFEITANGTYYAWVKDGAGNTTYKSFYFTKIDSMGPSISAVSVSTGWGVSNSVTITATDTGSGVAAYAVTSSDTAPVDGWQDTKSLTVSGNGTWYAWAKDNVGNVSAGYKFTVSQVDSTKPVVSAVAVPDDWATSAKVTLTASDEGGSGLSAYAVTSTNAAPATGWQPGTSFTLTSNGSYYAWTKDAAGNVSNGYQFAVGKIDTAKPAVDLVTVPTEWGPGSAITVKASDVGSGIAAYAVIKSSTAPTYGWQQSDSFALDSNATYFAWAKDNVGNVSAGFEFTVSKVDSTKPVINDISIPTEWTVSGQVSISATDAETGIAGYALTKSSTAPTSGWQESPDFTVTENGTWYAWVKDGAGNTAYKSCSITKIDTTAPTVTYATISTGWDTANTVTISANDAASGVTAYAVSTADTAPTTGWQESKTLTVTGNGTFYAWARDAVGNVSAGYKFTVSKVDSIKPVISAVAVPDEWATSAKVTVTAADEGGSSLTAYAITATDAAPTSGWQTGSSFTLTANGTYYAWVKDGAGNVSAAHKFTVSHVDTDKPVVDSVNIPTDWAMSGTVTIAASDTGSGIVAYAVTTGGSSAPVSGWQESNSFTFSANGKYYAWVKDIAGNVSASGFEFVLGKIDRTKPTITEVIMPESWTGTAQITIMATDEETGIAAYAVTANSTTPKDDAWQDSSVFTLAANGTYYTWAKDGAGNMAYQYIYFNKLDKAAPEITGIRFNNANTIVTVSAIDTVSGVKCIFIGETAFNGGYIQYQIPDGTHYLTIYAEDNAGNKTEHQTVRVPGWFDVLDTLTIEIITFDSDIKTAIITAATTKTEIAGVYVNNKLCAGNPAVFTVNGAQYLEMQVVDVNGDRSAVYRQRVPGWAEEVNSLAITDCEFSYDNTTAVITAAETPAEGVEPRGIARIEINGELFDGNPVAYSIPEGTRHLEMRAYNTDGDYSPLLIRRVPGWSEIVSTITISSVEFSDYNTRATVTALATGGDSVTGIFINDVYYEGNPVVYKIGKDVDTLHVQAVNPNGDLSAMVNKAVPKSTVKSTLKLTIEAPEWTSANRAKVKITAGDSIGLKAIMAKTGEDDDWTDVTSTRYIWIDEDTTVYASVENEDGTVKETSLDIVCFDRAAPTVTAAQQEKVVNIRAEDKKSGVKAIYVNNVEYNGSKIYGGNLTYTIPEGTTTVAVKAIDEAGNASETLELPVRTTVTAVPGIIAPSQPAPVAPPPDPEPAAIPDPEPEPEPEPVPQPEVEETPLEEPKAAGMTTEKMVALAAGAFTLSSAGTIGGLWWLRRKRLLAEVVPDFDPKFRKVYDESEFHGTKDPLGSNVTEVEFNRKIS